MTTDAGPVPARPKRRRGKLLPAPIWNIGKLLVIALIVEYLVLPQVAGTRKSLHLISNVHPGWLALGVICEAGALVCYSQLTRQVLPKESDPGLYTILRIQLTTLSVSHCVPAGSAAGSSLGYRLMTVSGSRSSDTTLAMSLQASGSAVILNVIFWIALAVSIPVWGFSPLDLTAGLVGMILVAMFVVLVLFLSKGEHWAHLVIDRLTGNRVVRRIPFVDPKALQASVSRLTERFDELGADRRLIFKASFWAAANWLLDAASLYVFVGAFGHWVNPDGLILAFAIAHVLAVIPITPGGLGVVEATLTSTLVGFGTPRGIAILGVIGYRLIQFWAPIPVGGLTYLSLHLQPGRTPLSIAAKEAEARAAPADQALPPPPVLGAVGLPEGPAPEGSASENGSARKDGAGDVPDLRGPPSGPVSDRR